MTNVTRIKKQKRFLYKRSQKIIIVGLNSIDELDALKALKTKEKEGGRKNSRS